MQLKEAHVDSNKNMNKQFTSQEVIQKVVPFIQEMPMYSQSVQDQKLKAIQNQEAIRIETLGRARRERDEYIAKQESLVKEYQQAQERKTEVRALLVRNDLQSKLIQVLLKDATKEKVKDDATMSVQWHKAQVKKQQQSKEKMMADIWKADTKAERDLHMQHMKDHLMQLQAEEQATRNKRINAELALENEVIASENFKLRRAQQVAEKKEKMMANIWKHSVADKKKMIRQKMLQSIEGGSEKSIKGAHEEVKHILESSDLPETISKKHIVEIFRKIASLLDIIMKNVIPKNKNNYVI